MGSCSHIANRRQARRFRTRHLAKIVLGPEAMISCTVEDISTGGARIALTRDMHLPDDFEIFIAAHDLQVHRARLCWRYRDSLGVSFVRSTESSEHTRALVHRMTQARSSFQDEFDRIRVEVERTDPDVQAPMRQGTA